MPLRVINFINGHQLEASLLVPVGPMDRSYNRPRYLGKGVISLPH